MNVIIHLPLVLFEITSGCYTCFTFEGIYGCCTLYRKVYFILDDHFDYFAFFLLLLIHI